MKSQNARSRKRTSTRASNAAWSAKPIPGSRNGANPRYHSVSVHGVGSGSHAGATSFTTDGAINPIPVPGPHVVSGYPEGPGLTPGVLVRVVTVNVLSVRS